MADKVSETEWKQFNCHCGRFMYEVLLAPLSGVHKPHKVMSCNCSTCSRYGYLNVYPDRHDVRVKLDDSGERTVKPGSPEFREHFKGQLGYYIDRGEHAFCNKCGCSLWVDHVGGEEGGKLQKRDPNGPFGLRDIVAINVRYLFFSRLDSWTDTWQVRNMRGFELNDLTVITYDGKNADPKYAEPWDQAPS